MIRPEHIQELVLDQPFDRFTTVVLTVRLTWRCRVRIYAAALAFWLASKALGCQILFDRARDDSEAFH